MSRLSILIYHRVHARPDPLFPGEVDAARFAAQMRLLKRCFRVLPLAPALRLLREGRLPARAAAISFDDGYADNCEVALPILQSLGLSATFFIASGYAQGGWMWNDKVIEGLRHAAGERLDLRAHGLGERDIASMAARRATLDLLLQALKYLPFEAREQAAAALGKLAEPVRMLSHEQIRCLHRAGMEIGAHTVRHPILSVIPDWQARAEIRASRRELEAVTGAPVSLFAYPNGQPGADYGPQHVEMVRELGFAAAVTTIPGAAGRDTDLYQLPRFTPWETAPLRFLLRLAQNRLRRPQPQPR